jgi:hypothetical protein
MAKSQPNISPFLLNSDKDPLSAGPETDHQEAAHAHLALCTRCSRPAPRPAHATWMARESSTLHQSCSITSNSHVHTMPMAGWPACPLSATSPAAQDAFPFKTTWHLCMAPQKPVPKSWQYTSAKKLLLAMPAVSPSDPGSCKRPGVPYLAVMTMGATFWSPSENTRKMSQLLCSLQARTGSWFCFPQGFFFFFFFARGNSMGSELRVLGLLGKHSIT